MRRQNKRIIFLQILLFWLTKIATAQPQIRLNFADSACLKSEDIATNSTYNNNIQTVLTKLHSFSSINKFSTASSGVGLDLVSGFYLCRPDLSLSNCRDCINATISTLLERCSDKKEAVVWYQECMIRYTNNSILAANGTDPWSYLYSSLNVSQPEVFPALVNNTIHRLISEAVSPKNEAEFPYFEYGEANFTALGGLYGMVLCRPDITAEECEHCLTTALDKIPTCCGGLSIVTYVFLPNCQVWYDTAPFLSPEQPLTMLSLAPTLAAPTPPSP
ncbi:Cysteine-rich receptor-like protein kinase 25 [Bienertia sinuspersici]